MTEDVDLSIYPLHVVKLAAYRFLGECSIHFEGIDSNFVRVQFQSMTATPAANLRERFRTELLDQDLRERLKQETAPLQNLILAYAFSGLTAMPGNSDDSIAAANAEGSGPCTDLTESSGNGTRD
jgi:His-Xaa-Ser system protein HxsD